LDHRQTECRQQYEARADLSGDGKLIDKRQQDGTPNEDRPYVNLRHGQRGSLRPCR
jgi:hypothetical protein